MDFRSENMLATQEDDSIIITGIVDAANCLAGDPAFDLARLEEGVGLSRGFLAGYAAVQSPPERDSIAFLLYRLETAALLTWVYRNSPHHNYRLRRLRQLFREVESATR